MNNQSIRRIFAVFKDLSLRDHLLTENSRIGHGRIARWFANRCDARRSALQAQALELFYQRYSDLFQLSPLPKFVFDMETFAFLNVNVAVIEHYGYSYEDFSA